MKSIKILLTMLAISSSALLNHSYALSGQELNKKIEETVKFENGALSLEKNYTDFVRVSFRINDEGKIEVLDLNFSNEKIKTQLIDKLAEIKIVGDYDSNQVYNYKFSFKQA